MVGVTSPREGTAADAIEGVVPRYVAVPDSPEAFAGTLASASSERLHTVIRGGGSKLAWGRRPATVDLVVSTARLNRLTAHRHGDLTATVQAGITLLDLNRTLRTHNQWLPVESAFDAATAGGLVATNDSGPSRHRNGTPRDLVIGVTLALTDGRLVKAGGTVVKNVAGYDLGKLVSGSHGSLAGIVDLTFKLVPMPHASQTLTVSYSDPETMAREAAALAASQLEPAAFDIRAVFDGERSSLLLHVRFASSPAATDAQVAAARSLLAGGEAALASRDAETELWMRQIREPWHGDGAVVRMSWLPARLPQVLSLVGRLERSGGRAAFWARAMGAGFLRLDGDAASQIAAIGRLRATSDVGHVVVLRASPEVKASVDVWGPPLESDPVARALKQMFDPRGILNAGRGPV
jgi:glycolate oxidase FAD binding subunit